MKMFQVTLFDENDLTGFTEVAYMCDLGDGDVTERHTFQTAQSARYWLAGIKRDYILSMYGRYVRHSKMLFDTGERSFYKTPARTASLDRMYQAMQQLQFETGVMICKYILAHETDLRNILPSPNNASFNNCEDRLVTMIVFSKESAKSSLSIIPIPPVAV
jgi:hypothetical protein